MIQWIKKATSKNITGNYKFYIKSQPQNIDNTTTISVTPFTDKSQSAIVPCHYKWFRVRNGLIQQSFKFRGNSYVCDSSDIGAIIQADVESNDPQYFGQASIQFGPVKLATQIKKHLMDALSSGSTFMRGLICLTDYQEKQCQFKMFQDMIKICHMQSQLNYSFNYSVIQPRVQIVPKDSTKLWLIFSNHYQSNPYIFMKNLFGQQYEQLNNTNNQCKIQIRFPTRQLKDIFLLTLKAFYTKKQLKNSVVIHKIQSATFNQKQDMNLLFQIESLRSDILRLYYSAEQKEKQKQTLSQDVIRLQRQIQEIITTYTRIAQQKFRGTRDLNESYTALTNKRDEVFGRKCQTLQKQNLGLNQRIRLLTAQIDQIRFNSSMVKRNQTIYMNANQNGNLNPNYNHNFTTVTSIKMKSQVPKNDMTSFDNILEHLSQSRVSQFNQQSFRMTKQLQKIIQQKFQLERKLQKSFRTIDDLQKKLKNPPQNYSTVINFNKAPQINTSSYQLAVDYEKLQLQNSRILGINQNLKKQNQNLQKQLHNSSSRIIIKPNPISSSAANNAIAMTTSIVNNQIKFNDNGSKSSPSRENCLGIQNDNLKKQIGVLKQKIKNQQLKVQRHIKDKIILQRKLEDKNNQLQMYKRNQDVLNRSQHLSMEMQSYNQEKMKVLKDHNDFLLSENEKLSKACEKYMAEARQNITLRKQLLQLKQKLGPKYLNPQKQSKSIYGSVYNNNNSQSSQIIGRNI